MKKLTLIRHGKASQDFGFKDFDRPLLTSGVQNTVLIATHFLNDFQIDSKIWSSSSKRTTETATTFVKCLKTELNRIAFKVDLYTFDAIELTKIIKSCTNQTENLIIFGHNSAITDFVNKFGDIYIDNVPTSGLVTIEFETSDWKSIVNGKTIKTLFPSQL